MFTLIRENYLTDNDLCIIQNSGGCLLVPDKDETRSRSGIKIAACSAEKVNQQAALLYQSMVTTHTRLQSKTTKIGLKKSKS